MITNRVETPPYYTQAAADVASRFLRDAALKITPLFPDTQVTGEGIASGLLPASARTPSSKFIVDGDDVRFVMARIPKSIDTGITLPVYGNDLIRHLNENYNKLVSLFRKDYYTGRIPGAHERSMRRMAYLRAIIDMVESINPEFKKEKDEFRFSVGNHNFKTIKITLPDDLMMGMKSPDEVKATKAYSSVFWYLSSFIAGTYVPKKPENGRCMLQVTVPQSSTKRGTLLSWVVQSVGKAPELKEENVLFFNFPDEARADHHRMWIHISGGRKGGEYKTIRAKVICL